MPLRTEKGSVGILNTFQPEQFSENLVSYFDLPEEESLFEEEEDTETLILLEDLISETNTNNQKETKKKWSFPTLPSFAFPALTTRHSIGAFIVLSFIFVLPLHAMQVVNNLREAKSSAEAKSISALQNLEAATGTNLVKNPGAAGRNFAQAHTEFGQAKSQIDNLGGGVSLLLAALTPTQKSLRTNTALLKIGTELSLAGTRIASGFDAMQQETNPTPASRLELMDLYFTSALPHLEKAESALKNIDLEEIEQKHKETVTELMTTLPLLVDSTKKFITLSDTLLSILGTNGTKNYLLIFQNNTELRATGGFMGSYAEMTVHNGVMEQFEIPGGGTYDLQGQQKQFYVAPWPLQLLSAKWEFQDANWFPDFRTSARQTIKFYENARSSSIDGVISINASYVEELIGLLGPIEVPEFQRTISQENFLPETQKIVEHEYDKEENKPKAFIGALAPKLIEKALKQDPNTFFTLVEHLLTGLSQKEIQLYFTDNAVEKTILAQGWGGELKQTDKDYLMVVNTNLGGGKTDLMIKEEIDVQVNVTEEGQIQNTVTIKRKHTGVSGDAFYGSNNVNYLRLYVPKGSTLIHADGFNIPRSSLFEIPEPEWVIDPDLQFADASFNVETKSGTQIYEEQGKTVFGNWTQTKPGEETITTFTYKLPFTLAELLKEQTTFEKAGKWFGYQKTDTYSLFIQKQSGANNRTYQTHIQLPQSIQALWSSSPLADSYFSDETDVFLSALLEYRL